MRPLRNRLPKMSINSTARLFSFSPLLSRCRLSFYLPSVFFSFYNDAPARTIRKYTARRPKIMHWGSTRKRKKLQTRHFVSILASLCGFICDAPRPQGVQCVRHCLAHTSGPTTPISLNRDTNKDAEWKRRAVVGSHATLRFHRPLIHPTQHWQQRPQDSEDAFMRRTSKSVVQTLPHQINTAHSSVVIYTPAVSPLDGQSTRVCRLFWPGVASSTHTVNHGYKFITILALLEVFFFPIAPPRCMENGPHPNLAKCRQ